jgi:Flp pilus assembly protein TadG
LARKRLHNKVRRGAALIETAIALTTFIVLTFGIFEHGRILMMRQLLENAAREGARQAMVGTGTLTTANIQAIVTNYLVNAPLTNLNIQVYATDATGANIGVWNNATFGNGVAVQVDADGKPVLATLGLLPSSLHFRVKSIMRCEGN